MSSHPLSFALLLLSAGLTIAVGQPAYSQSSDTVITSQAVNEFAKLIDQQLGEVHRLHNLHPAPLANSQTLLRRVTLDLVGRVPTEQEVRRYLQDDRDDKYRRVVERLLASPEFDRHQAVMLRRIWLPQLETQQFAHLTDDYQNWLTRQLADDVPYDELVSRQLTTPVEASAMAVNPKSPDVGSPVFLAAADFDPARIAANSMRAFLGLNLDCAQCHDHPFARWSQQDFWRTAAFFSDRSEATSPETSDNHLTIRVADTQQFVSATFLDGRSPPSVDSGQNRFRQGRTVFAQWATCSENPYFARNAVNRVWAVMFGLPLVSPVDDLSEANQTATSAVLARLADRFVAERYQLVSLYRAIALSDAYQMQSGSLSSAADRSEPPESSEDPITLFAARQPRFMTSAQLVNSILVVGGSSKPMDDRRSSSTFAREFYIAEPTGTPRSLVQSLMMMNGDFVQAACSPTNSPLLKTLANTPYLDSQASVETLMLRALSRLPSESERQLFLKAVDQADSVGQAYSDILWTLLNSAEFSVYQ